MLLSLAMVSSQLANLGTKNTIIRYFPFFRDKEKKHHGSLFLSLAIPFLGLLVLAAFLYFLRPEITRYFIERSALLVDYYWLIIPLAFFILFFHVLSSYIRALYDTVMSSFLMDVIVRVLTASILVLYFFEFITFDHFMYALVSIYGVVMLWLFFYTMSQFEVNLKPDFSYLRRSLVKSMANYSMYAFFGGLASILVNNIDIIMLSSLAGLSDTGIYAIAFYVGSAIIIPRRSIVQISSPVISDAFKSRDMGLINKVYRRSSLNLLIVGGLVYCGVIANIPNLMNLLPPEYSGGAIVIMIIATANIIDMITGVNGAIILNSKYYRFDLYSTLILLTLTITLNYLLIPQYGILGAAIGTGTSIALYNFIKVLYVWIRFSMQPFEKQMFWVFGVGGLTLFLISYLPKIGNTYSDIIIRSILITGIYCLPIWKLNISEEFNNLFTESISRIRDLFKD